MKKYFKFIAPVLAIVLVIGVFTACGRAEPSFQETLAEVGTHENFDFVVEIDSSSKRKYNTSEDYLDPQILKFKLSGKVQGDNTAFVNVEMFDKEANAYKPLTDLYLIGEDAYINMYALYGALDTMTGSEGQLIENFKSKNHYYKFNLKEKATETIEMEDASIEDPAVVLEFVNDVAGIGYNAFIKGTEGIEPPVINAVENGHQIKLNNENVVPLVKNIATILESTIDTEISTLITKYREKGMSYNTIVEALETFRDEEMEDFKEMLAELKEFEMKESDKLDCVATITNVDKTSNVDIKINSTSEHTYVAGPDEYNSVDPDVYDDLEFDYDMETEDSIIIDETTIAITEDSDETSEEENLSYTTEQSINIKLMITENKDVKITAPTNILTDEEFEEYCGDFSMLIMSFMMMGLGETMM